ncbi:unnamed protein product, partial [Mesorhabditis belari]|uniref:Golgi apparatus membrane protein TVP23 homolog n=1 Tax=Mesorhabditis belari TaxID=2138241 RepID=A0AAF3EN80_9BILA
MASSFDSSLNLGAAPQQSQGFSFRLFRYPTVAIAHVAFRSAALFFYVFCTQLTSSFIVQFLILLTLLSMDFWTVKNVTGRLMVGLRWWNFVDSEGKNHWKYESSKDPSKFPALDRNFFWLALVAAPLAWSFFVALAFMFLHWQWAVVALLGFVMTSANLYGYLRCRWADTNQFTSAVSKWAFLNMLRRQTAPSQTQSTQLNYLGSTMIVEKPIQEPTNSRLTPSGSQNNLGFSRASSSDSSSNSPSREIVDINSLINPSTRYAFCQLAATVLKLDFLDQDDSTSILYCKHVLQVVLEYLAIPVKSRKIFTSYLEEDVDFPDVATLIISIKEDVVVVKRGTNLFLSYLLYQFVATSHYDSRTRVLLRHLSTLLAVVWEEFEEIENSLVSLMLDEFVESEQSIKAREKIAKSKKLKRYLMIGAAGGVGGVLIGLTGGLAAPLVAIGAGAVLGGAATAAIGTTVGAAILGTTFGVAGAGLAGYKAMEYLVSAAASAGIQQALMQTALAGLVAAVAWPVAILSCASVLDNPWNVSIARSAEVGEQLAEVLLSRAQGSRPISLVGYSLGARVIFHCLMAMSKRTDSAGIVEDVVLLGAPVSASASQWSQISHVVGGRIINGYCETDWLLRFVYRTMSVQFAIAGTSAINIKNRKIVNYNVSHIVKGHMDYSKKLTEILKAVGVRTTPHSAESENSLCTLCDEATEIKEQHEPVVDPTPAIHVSPEEIKVHDHAFHEYDNSYSNLPRNPQT